MNNIPKWLVQAIAGLLAIFLVVLVIGKTVEIKNQNKTLGEAHTISISAEGKVTATPDLAIISASIVVDGDTALKVQQDANKKTDAVISFLKSQDIAKEDIKTTAYNTYPKYDYKGTTPNIVGYTATQSLSIKIHKLDAVGNVLDGLTKNGANQIDSVNYDFNDPDGFKEKAREQALSNARSKAQNLASAAGVSLGKLVSFSESSSGFPMPMAMDKSLEMGMGGAAPQATVEPGTQDVTAQVNVIYQIK